MALARTPRPVAAVALLACLAAPAAHALAEQPPRKSSKPAIEFTLFTWLTEGKTRWNFSNRSPLFGNPTSELNYKDVGTTVVELGGKAIFPNRFFVHGQFGYGTVGGGRLTDDDYLAGQQLFSRTDSNLDGSHVWYLNADIGYQLILFPQNRGYLGAFIGYQHRDEKLEATGVTQVVCTAPGVLCNPAGTVSNVGQVVLTNTSHWNALRIGLEGDVRVAARLTVEGQFAFLPFTALTNDDIHHLRTDLKQDPSIRMTGTGIGYNAEAKASVLVYEQLFFDVGYRYWWQKVSDGDIVFRGTTGDSPALPLNEFRSIRQGVTFGLRYTF